MQKVLQHITRTMRGWRTPVEAAIFAAVLTWGQSTYAQAYYYINGAPAPLNFAHMMAAYGLPFGDYWLDASGNWGMVGNPQPMGNIHSGGAQGQRPGRVNPGGSTPALIDPNSGDVNLGPDFR